MTTLGQILARRRRQILDDDTIEAPEPHTPEQEDSWIGDFIARLAGVLRSKSGKR
jgi:hypothetical protein